jgi:hypothetical protein
VGWTEPLARSQRNATITVVASTSALGFLTTVGAPLALVKVLLLTRAAGTIATVVTWAGWRRRLPSPEVLPPVATN